MPYEIELDRDTDRGLDRYTITLDARFDSDSAHALGDWMTAAAQNPTATFRIDVSGVGRSRPVATLLARSGWLRARRRVEVVRRRLSARGAALVIGGAEALLPPLL